jgi:hypothetical protein
MRIIFKIVYSQAASADKIKVSYKHAHYKQLRQHLR